MLLKEVDLKKIQGFVAIQIGKLASRVNIAPNLNIQAHQVRDIAEQLVELYPVESLEDFVLCFKRGGLGFYGTIYRLDASVLTDWMAKYLDEKYGLIESGYNKAKKEEAEQAPIDYEKFKERAAEFVESPKKHNNAAENDYQRRKLENPYRWYNIGGIEIYATSQQHAEQLAQGAIDRGEIEVVKDGD